MKRIIIHSLIIGTVIAFANGFSSTHAQFYIQQGDDRTLCKDTSKDPLCASSSQQREQYCASSTICGSAPQEFSLMLEFVEELANSIKTLWTEGSYLWQYVNPNRFLGNTFSPPQQGIVTKLARNIAQKIKFWLASTAIFSNISNFSGTKDMLGWIFLAGKNKVFMRDAKLLEQVETIVNTKKYELGVWWWRWVEVNSENLAIMQNIIKTYQNKWLLSWTSFISKGVTYNNITSLLTQFLSSFKTVLYYNTVEKLHAVSKWWADGIRIEITREAEVNIYNDYSCARWFFDVCNQPIKKFTSTMTNLRTVIKKGATSWFVDVIKQANENLMQTFTKSSNLKDREQDLIKSMYGSSKIHPNTWLLGPLKNTWQSIKDSAKGVASEVKDAGEDVVNFWSGDTVSSWNVPKTIEERNKKIKITQEESTLPSTINLDSNYIAQTKFDKVLKYYLEDVFVDQTVDSALATSAELKEITPAFTILGQQIITIKNDIIGDKWKNGTLIQSLWEACELQCGGGWRCRK